MKILVQSLTNCKSYGDLYDGVSAFTAHVENYFAMCCFALFISDCFSEQLIVNLLSSDCRVPVEPCFSLNTSLRVR